MDLTTSPFKRLREAAGLSGIEFTREAGIARTTTVYLDAGLFLVPRANETLQKVYATREFPWDDMLEEEYGSPNLETATVLWQRAVRASHADRINDAYVMWMDNEPIPGTDPFTQFAEFAFENKDQFCKAMKVQTGPIKLWLESKTRPLPPTLREALLDAGLTPVEIANIESDVSDWRMKNVESGA